MYKKYYSQELDNVINGLKEWKRNGRSVAVWGAGARCREFLKNCDSAATYIDYVFDINLAKCGERLPTGHRVFDYRYQDVNVVLFIDPFNTIESVLTLLSDNLKADVCCLENVYWGKMSLQDSVYLGRGMPTQLASKIQNIYAITILYNPGNEVVNNIKSYLPFVDRIYIYDNSPNDNAERFSEFTACNNVIYKWAKGENNGIGLPINEISNELPNDRASWLITFDQDSRIYNDMIQKMRRYIESDLYDDKVGIVAPVPKNMLKLPFNNDSLKKIPYITYKQDVLQSGAMHRLDVLKEVGGYNEELFIDQVDLEYCTRCRVNGYKIVQIGDAYMYHQVEDIPHKKIVNGKNIVIDKYSPERFYYQYRNQLYLASKYEKIDPAYSEQCLNGCEYLRNQAKHETKYIEIKRMMNQAVEDAEKGRLGRYIYKKCEDNSDIINR